MSKWLPRTLVGQMIAILLGGLLFSHLVTSWIYSSDRDQALRAVGGFAVTQRIANLARLIDEAPADWRDRIVAAASDPTLRVSLSAQPPFVASAGSDDADVPIRQYLAGQLPDALASRLRIAVTGTQGPLAPQFQHTMPMMGPWMHGAMSWRSLEAAVQLSNGQWLSFVAALPNAGPAASWQFMVAMLFMSVIVVFTSIWAVRRVTAPLSILARAAEQLGRDVNAPPVAEVGSSEMRQAAHAFNEMQGRLQRLIQNRTRILAALSHDLRTPLTLLRLRTEGLPEGEDRERMLANIGELDTMIEGTLRFARDEAAAEPLRKTDLTALMAAIVDDMADVGLPVTLVATAPVVLECHPSGLRRAVVNLLDNALKYGKLAQVSLLATPNDVTIRIDDEGPGIPQDELANVLEPFYRLEQSRNRETGGAGLGLAIAQSVAQAHGGQISLTNRPGGGLRAEICLPR